MAATKETLKNGETRWKDRIWVNGKRLKVTARTKQELTDNIQTLQERERRRKKGIPEPVDTTTTYDELCEKLLGTYGKREQSKEALENNLKRSRERFGPELVRSIIVEDVETWFASLVKKNGEPYAPTTKWTTLKAMRQVLNYGVKRNYLTDNVAREVELPELEDTADPFTSWQEVSAIAAALSESYVYGDSLVRFVAGTGLRMQEWQVLRWSDLDLAGRIVYVRRTVQAGVEKAKGKSKNALAPVWLQAVAVEAIKAMPTPLDRNQLVFPSTTGEVWKRQSFREDYWTPALTQAGVRYRPPSQLRHTYATLALTAGVPLEWISEQLRHEKLDTTRKYYSRWLPKGHQRWLDVLDAFAKADPNETLDAQEGLG